MNNAIRTETEMKCFMVGLSLVKTGRRWSGSGLVSLWDGTAYKISWYLEGIYGTKGLPETKEQAGIV